MADTAAIYRPDDGVWVARYGDRSATFVFACEVDALRHAVGMSMDVEFIPWGEDAARYHPEVKPS